MNPLTIIAFLFIFGLVVFLHELGHFVTAKLARIKVEEFGFGFPPRVFGIRRGETEYTINLIPIGGFVRMLGEDDPKEPRSFARAPKRWRFAVLAAGATMNILTAILLFGAAFMTGWPTPTEFGVSIRAVVPGTPAEAAGLQQGDVVKALAGRPINASGQLAQITQANRGKEIPMRVKRGNQELTLNVTPRATWPEGQGPMGVAILDVPTKMALVSYPVGESLRMGAERTWEVISLTLHVPVMAIQGQISASEARPIGPVGIFQMTTEAADATIDTGLWYPVLTISALFSAAVGLANILPIPGLDGGRLLFVVIEAVRRRRIDPRKEGMVHLVGMAFLISLVLVVTYFDISNPVPSVDWVPR